MRQRLQQQGYNCAQIIPLKVFDSEDEMLTICDVLDCCIGFSKQYEKRLKRLLDKKKTASLNRQEKMELENFVFSLDHDMLNATYIIQLV